MPTLAEALQIFPEARFNVDIKDRRAAHAARDVIEAHDAADRVLIAAWYSWRRKPAIYGYRGPRSVTLDQMLGYLPLVWCRLDGLWCPDVDALQLPEKYRGLRVVSPRLFKAAHRAGIRVHVWTVDDETDMSRLLEWGADGIVTKKPDVAVAVRERFLSGQGR